MGYPDAVTAEAVSRQKQKDSYIEWLKKEENEGKAGYDTNTKLWKPHSSPEGGEDTIGYGYKLTAAEQKSQTVTINGKSVSYKNGLNNSQINDMIEQEVDTAFKSAKSVFVKKYSDADWNSLSEDSKYLLTDYAYNVIGGVGKYPSMMEGVKEGDWKKVEKEYKRGFWKPSDSGTHKKDDKGEYTRVKSGGTHTFLGLARNKKTYEKFIKPNLSVKDVGSLEDMILNNMLEQDRGYFA